MRIPFGSFLLVAALPLSVAFLAPGQNATAPGSQANKIMLFQVSPYEVRPGDTVVLQGSGFSTSQNSVYFGSYVNVSATSTNGAVMSVAVPSSLPFGEYNVVVSNTLGSSADVANSVRVSIKVTGSPRTPPVITNASVSAGVVTLVGDGFSSTNSLVTNLGNLEGVPSFDGRSITFQINNLSEYARIKRQLGNKSIQTTLVVHISNDRGSSKNPYSVNITI